MSKITTDLNGGNVDSLRWFSSAFQFDNYYSVHYLISTGDFNTRIKSLLPKGGILNSKH